MLTTILTVALAAQGSQEIQARPGMLTTGKLITPTGRHIGVGSHPISLAVSPDNRHLIVSDIGFRQYLTALRTSDGSMAAKLEFKSPAGLYYGLAFQPGTSRLFASRGAEDKVVGYDMDGSGSFKEAMAFNNPKKEGNRLPNHAAGISFTSDGSKLVVVDNQTAFDTDYKGGLTVMDAATGAKIRKVAISGFPLGLALITKGAGQDEKAYVGSERDGLLDVVNIKTGKVMRQVRTGAAPVGMILNSDQTRLYVANSGSDTVSVVNTATDNVIDTILIRPSDLRGLPGSAPTGLALGSDGNTLYVTLADMNALAVVNLKRKSLMGMIPTGWLPNAVAAVNGKIWVAESKGVWAQNPNGKAVGDRGTYGPNIIEGTVSIINPPTPKELEKMTDQVIKNNRLRGGLNSARHPMLKDPGITHVIYVIKENRTYDNVLGDLPQGNGDKSLTLFPRRITPNQHALAERFVLLDNFHVCAEVSQDGWVWSTAGMVNPYASRNTPYNYSRRGRNYDTEGTNNGVPIDLIGMTDVTRPPSGYIWELCNKYGVTFRNYGFFTQFLDSLDKRHTIMKEAVENGPTKKLLAPNTNTSFRRYDLEYADSDAYDKYNWSWPRRRATFGDFKSPSRFSEWNREFKQFVAKGSMPQFQMVRFGQDHTSGTSRNQPTPESMVADNDYAVGQMVEAVSNSPFWKSTVICILEDDAQAGIDHVDSHRSTAYVISPFIKKGTVDSRFYNTDSMLRTMEILLGLPPMSQYDAVASPIAVFGSKASNIAPYKAILPPRDVICKANGVDAYRSKDSDRISLYVEEGDIDEDLNDILWGAIKGADSPRPLTRRGLRLSKDED